MTHYNVTDIVERTIKQKLIVADDPFASRIGFLEDAARHFERQPTNGEDKAHWANIYNAKNCRKIATDLATLRKQLENAREALDGYRAAVSFISADSWDGCSDCINILKAARCADMTDAMTINETAEHLKRIRLHYDPNREALKGPQ